MSIRSFKHKWLEDFYYKDIGKSLQPQLRVRVFRRLKLLDYASTIEDLRSPPANRLHKLCGDRENQWSMAVNATWRLCFYFVEGEAVDVELIQYH